MKHLYENQVTEWFVAESVEQAIELARAWYVDVCRVTNADEMDLEFRQCPDDVKFTFVGYGGGDENAEVTKTAAEFAAENEPGFLATTEY